MVLGAEQHYLQVLEANPLEPEANHNLGVLLALKEKFEDSEILFETALKERPNNEFFWVSLIKLNIKFGNQEKALGLLKDASQRGIKGPFIKAISDDLNKKPPVPNDHSSVESNVDQRYALRSP